MVIALAILRGVLMYFMLRVRGGPEMYVKCVLRMGIIHYVCCMHAR